MTKEKVFITGAAGYVASRLARTLAEKGYTVHGLIRSKSSEWLVHENIVVFTGDILKPETIKAAMKGCTQVYHVAALSSNWSKNPQDFYKTNIGGTLNVLDCAKELGVKKVVITSSAGTIGPGSEGKPASEEGYRKVEFFGDYEASKVIADEKALRYVLNGMNIVFVCPTRIYGPGVMGKTNRVTEIINKYRKGKWHIKIGMGHDTGNYVFVEDVVEGHILAMEKGKPGEKYIIGGYNATFIEFIDSVREASGVNKRLIPVPLGLLGFYTRFEDFFAAGFGFTPFFTHKWIEKFKEDWTTDISKAKRELGYKPVGLNEGVKKTIDWLVEKNY